MQSHHVLRWPVALLVLDRFDLSSPASLCAPAPGVCKAWQIRVLKPALYMIAGVIHGIIWTFIQPPLLPHLLSLGFSPVMGGVAFSVVCAASRIRVLNTGVLKSVRLRLRQQLPLMTFLCSVQCNLGYAVASPVLGLSTDWFGSERVVTVGVLLGAVGYW